MCIRCREAGTRETPRPTATRLSVDAGLIHGFDGVRSNFLLCLITLRYEVLKGCRVAPRLRLLKAVPLGNGHDPGCISRECDGLSSGGVEYPTTARADRTLNKRSIRRLGCIVDHLDLSDDVGFWFGLGVQTLHRRDAERGTGGDRHRDLEVRIHGAFLFVGRVEAIRS